jgi:peptidoglycan/xylan/chitin deacetylase (PgdA/CDA1 family)
MNRELKHAAERVALMSGIPTITRRLRRRRALILAYHNVVPTGELASGDLSLHLAEKSFAEQLDYLGDTCDVVSLTDLIENAPANPVRPRVAITFDDAYAGAATAGLDELNRRDMPCMIFVAPGLLGNDTWWDIVARSMGGEIPAHTRLPWLNGLAGDGEEILRVADSRVTENATRPTGPAMRIASMEVLNVAAARSGVSIGSHTWTHRNLAALSPDRLRSELVQPIEWLGERFASFVPLLSYPYGLSSKSVEAAAAQAGYRAAFRVDGGWISERPDDSRFALPRLNVAAGLSLDGFRLRLSGIGAA